SQDKVPQFVPQVELSQGIDRDGAAGAGDRAERTPGSEAGQSLILIGEDVDEPTQADDVGPDGHVRVQAADLEPAACRLDVVGGPEQDGEAGAAEVAHLR